MVIVASVRSDRRMAKAAKPFHQGNDALVALRSRRRGRYRPVCGARRYGPLTSSCDPAATGIEGDRSAVNPSSVHVNREGYSSFQLHPIISNSRVAHRHRIFASEARFWLITDAPIVAGYGCTVTRLFNDLWGRYRRNVRKSPYCVTHAACRTSSSCEPSLIMVFPRYSPSRRATWLLGICRSG
jgi:hypothetical protein